ncbi:MAG TPA: hypothetical protein VF909_05050, partial [Roseiflexaceae bacterium]
GSVIRSLFIVVLLSVTGSAERSSKDAAATMREAHRRHLWRDRLQRGPHTPLWLDLTCIVAWIAEGALRQT